MLLLFLSKSAFFVNPEIADLSTKFLLFMLLSTIFLVNLFQSAVVIYLASISQISA